MPAKGSGKGSGVPRSGGPRAGRRAVVLVDISRKGGPRDLEICARYILERRLTLVCVAASVDDALHEVTTGRADVVVTPNTVSLLPRIEIVSLAGDWSRPELRRPQWSQYPQDHSPRTGRVYPPPDDDEPRTGRVEPRDVPLSQRRVRRQR